MSKINIVHDKNKRRARGCNFKAKRQDRARLIVRRTSQHIYAQVISHVDGTVIASASTLEKDFTKSCGMKAAAVVGKVVAERTIAAGCKAVCFDRNGLKYHGCVKSLADAARATGLDF
ncbi:MAG: 50S ribosomal protein L18 [Legionellales bacterium]|nr:MAG: 50S ribosomal protein L18 [Legionellales bacterium]